MNNEKWFQGYKALKKKLNISRELKKFRKDPMEPFFRLLDKEQEFTLFADDIYRYREAYNFFYLSLTRFLLEMSIAVRWSNGPYYVRKSRGKYSESQRKLANKYNAISKYLAYDFFNCILHSRILMDKTIGLSRYFITNNQLPSFTSFNNHKKFFKKLKENNEELEQFEDYARCIREETDWFDIPLKIVRDKYLVHAGPKHMRFFGFPGIGHELSLVVVLPAGDEEKKPLSKVNCISVSIPQLANDIQIFLIWFSNYGINCLEKRRT
ncbi:MAG TPA: hypothetical protein DCK79_06485 [Candidatus Atribacteria bacterium]|jgi:hypothetical protein|nr:hypothetical protein [Candidatus Atribacteria bacterium]